MIILDNPRQFDEKNNNKISRLNVSSWNLPILMKTMKSTETHTERRKITNYSNLFKQTKNETDPLQTRTFIKPIDKRKDIGCQFYRKSTDEFVTNEQVICT